MRPLDEKCASRTWAGTTRNGGTAVEAAASIGSSEASAAGTEPLQRCLCVQEKGSTKIEKARKEGHQKHGTRIERKNIKKLQTKFRVIED